MVFAAGAGPGSGASRKDSVDRAASVLMADAADVRAAQVILKNLGWRFCSMAKLVFGLNQSLDGYVDHHEFAPGPSLFRHFTEQVRDLAGSVYGRRMYEVMRYWDEDQSDWVAEERDFAAVWRRQPKWVVSRSPRRAW